MQKGLDLLLSKYTVDEDAVISPDGASATVANGEYKLLFWEAERRISELYNIYMSGRLGDACTYRISHIAKQGSDIWSLLWREAGILSFTVNSDITEIFAIGGERTMNCIATCANGTIATIELAATLAEGEGDIDKHEIICVEGVACDRVVDTQVPQQSIYLFGENKETYKDVDAELFGYSEDDVARIRTAFRLAKDEGYRAESARKAALLDKVVACAKVSLEKLENVKVG